MPLFGRQKYTLVKVKKKNIPEGIWSKCPECEAPVYVKALKDNLNVCLNCQYHFTLTAKERVALLIDEGSFEELDAHLMSKDPLKFEGPKTYESKLAADQKNTGLQDAVITGRGMINGHATYFGVTDSQFIMGSMGSVVGERVTRMVEQATEHKKPVIIVSGSGGGARMYEGMYSLMQMAKTCAALRRHHEAGGVYISVLANPTMGGVMASFAGVGDVIIAEPRALIGFAGPRVIEQTTRQRLPEGFQRSEFLLAHGLIDMIVERKDLKKTIADIIGYSQPE
ncbi:MAG TPA: acetyl-CoA carboxylase, carboxyltransferase subunit beta [Candidatus Omnitrophota bacterium]|nr:acetyl-CoA carboxylase, carboxyltransferase subunit beta [Candidatus Omnitrophota bacterium]